jgi:hypothetical protein
MLHMTVGELGYMHERVRRASRKRNEGTKRLHANHSRLADGACRRRRFCAFVEKTSALVAPVTAPSVVVEAGIVSSSLLLVAPSRRP